MHTLDWLVLAAYLTGIMGMAIGLGRRHRSADDYYLAGRRMKAWPIALSILATQVSAVSLIGAPAFVALRSGGGLRWLQYELAVPLAMIAVILVFVPRLRPLRITTLYEYLQIRFGPRARRAMSVVFLLSRGLSTAVALYAASVVLTVCLGLPLAFTLVLLASFTIAYTTIGGIEADIYSDIAQMFILAAGTVVALVIALLRVAESANLAEACLQTEPGRLQVLDSSGLGLAAGETYGFWPMLIGGFFLYVSYYGCDQSQAQRLLTSKDTRESMRGLFLNGLLRFPFTLLYCLFGLVLAVFLEQHPEFAARIPAGQPDYLVPMFVLEQIPTGLAGLVIAAIFAASMSSFDSAFNSMSAVTMRNILGRIGEGCGTLGRASVRQSRLWTLVWGVLCAAAGYMMSRSQATVIELINMIGSAFYGPTLAIFVLGLLSHRAGETGVLFGLAAGVGVNVSLWLFAPQVSWLWWNVTGFVACAAVGYGLGLLSGAHVERVPPPPLPATRRWVLTLALAFLGILASCFLLQGVLLGRIRSE